MAEANSPQILSHCKETMAGAAATLPEGEATAAVLGLHPAAAAAAAVPVPVAAVEVQTAAEAAVLVEAAEANLVEEAERPVARLPK